MPEHVVKKISGHAPDSGKFHKYVSIAQNYLDSETDKVFAKFQGMNGEFEFGPELFQQVDVAATFVPENKVGADAQALNVTEITAEPADEGVASLFAERLVEMD